MSSNVSNHFVDAVNTLRGKVKWIPGKATDGAAHVVEKGIIGGGRNESDLTNNLTVTKEECNATVIDGTASVELSATPAYLMGVLVVTSGTTLTIVGFTDQADVAKSVVLTSSAASQYFDFKASRCESGLSVTASVDDDVVVYWRPMA